MEEVRKLKYLIDFGIQISLLARECHCAQSTIYKYINGESLPSGSKQIALREGLNHLLKSIEAIVRE